MTTKSKTWKTHCPFSIIESKNHYYNLRNQWEPHRNTITAQQVCCTRTQRRTFSKSRGYKEFAGIWFNRFYNLIPWPRSVLYTPYHIRSIINSLFRPDPHLPCAGERGVGRAEHPYISYQQAGWADSKSKEFIIRNDCCRYLHFGSPDSNS